MNGKSHNRLWMVGLILLLSSCVPVQPKVNLTMIHGNPYDRQPFPFAVTPSASSPFLPTQAPLPTAAVRIIPFSPSVATDIHTLSPDGQWVILSSTESKDYGRPLEIVSMKNPSRRIQVPYNSEEDQKLMLFRSWSPDSKAFVFLRQTAIPCADQLNIYKIKPDNQIERIHLKLENCGNLVWYPDSTLIANDESPHVINIINLQGEIVKNVKVDHQLHNYRYIWTKKGIVMVASVSIKGTDNYRNDLRFLDPTKDWTSQTMPFAYPQYLEDVLGSDPTGQRVLISGQKCETCSVTLWVYDLLTARSMAEFTIANSQYGYEFCTSASGTLTGFSVFNKKEQKSHLYGLNWQTLQMSDYGLMDELIGWNAAKNGFVVTTLNGDQISSEVIIPQ